MQTVRVVPRQNELDHTWHISCLKYLGHELELDHLWWCSVRAVICFIDSLEPILSEPRVVVPGGSKVKRVLTVEVDVVGSSTARDSFILLIIDRPKARERELAKFDADRRAVGNAPPYAR